MNRQHSQLNEWDTYSTKSEKKCVPKKNNYSNLNKLLSCKTAAKSFTNNIYVDILIHFSIPHYIFMRMQANIMTINLDN